MLAESAKPQPDAGFQLPDDDLDAEWRAILAGDDPAALAPPILSEPPTDRALDETEIERLLNAGLDAAPVGAGMAALLDRSTVSYERLPMLEVIVDRLARLLGAGLGALTGDIVDVISGPLVAVRCGDYLSRSPAPAVLSVFQADPLGGHGLLTLDGDLAYSLIDSALGGRRGGAVRLEGRAFSRIDRGVLTPVIERALTELGEAFAPVLPVRFSHQRLETSPFAAAVAAPTDTAVLVRLTVAMDRRGGVLELLLPHAMLEPIRKRLLQPFAGEKFGHDTVWKAHLETELRSARLEVQAVLDEQSLPLGRLLDLRVGETLMLGAGPDSLVQLRAGCVPLARARLGRRNVSLAVRLETAVTAVTASTLEPQT